MGSAVVVGAVATAVGITVAPPAPVDRPALAWSMASRVPLGTVRTVENRKNDRPAVRNKSPIDATLFSGGMGRGIRSASGPRRNRNSGPRVGGKGMCSTVPIAPERPEASYAGIQTGM